jgi:hypothetical protein
MVTDHPKFASGNVNTKTPNGEKGWILGHFIDASSPFHNMGFEIKWSNSRKGDKKPEPALNVKAKSVVILVYGSFRIDFPDEKKSFTLRDEGDYVFFNVGVTHSWEVLEDSLLITIRWPSTPNDQKPA